MTRLVGPLVATLFMFLITACTGTPAPEVTVDDPVLMEGRDVYVQHCTACHGATGGGGRGSKLNEGRLEQRIPDPAVQIELITNGRSSMPSFGGRLTEAEIEAVVRYTREVL